MHYLRRKIDSYLTNWKEDKDRKPLIIKGARQIGKTEAVINFAQKHYSNIVKINFAEEPTTSSHFPITAHSYSNAILKA